MSPPSWIWPASGFALTRKIQLACNCLTCQPELQEDSQFLLSFSWNTIAMWRSPQKPVGEAKKMGLEEPWLSARMWMKPHEADSPQLTRQLNAKASVSQVNTESNREEPFQLSPAIIAGPQNREGENCYFKFWGGLSYSKYIYHIAKANC